MRVSDITPGAKFGRWVAVERVPKTLKRRSKWRCRCECGAVSDVAAHSLVSGATKSCGCYRHHTTSADGAAKYCSGCREHVPLKGFSFMVRRGKTVPRNRCRSCASANNKTREMYYRLWSVKRRYGLSADDYAALYERASSSCEVCGRREDEVPGFLCIDHCHVSNRVRGLLCRNCNSAIGKLGESASMLQKAIEYLARG